VSAAADAFVAAFQAHVAADARLVAELNAAIAAFRRLGAPCRTLARLRRRLLRQRRRACLRHLGYVPPKSPGWPDVPLSEAEKRAAVQRALAGDAADRQGAMS
jgi:hypothetical protein